MSAKMPDVKIIAFDDFSRRFASRNNNLMWLLGAGVSASGGIPTAQDMIWDFKTTIYSSQKKVPIDSLRDLSDQTLREAVDSYFETDLSESYGQEINEYAILFERAYFSEEDRRRYIDSKVSLGKASYGHLGLAALLKSDKARIVWTTNFDALLADACSQVYGNTASLSDVTIENAQMLSKLVAAERWPIGVKLHGDFRSTNLKNIPSELADQDATLRSVFSDLLQRTGLIVAGYSGRDNSIMETLSLAARDSGSFPHGFFWMIKEGVEPPQRLVELLGRLSALGVENGLVPISNFDEAVRDLIKVIPGILTPAISILTKQESRWSPPPKQDGKQVWPIVRLNAIQVANYPKSCRLVDCSIGGTSEVKKIVKQHGDQLIATRNRSGVLAFGTDRILKEVFGSKGIVRFDVFPINDRDLVKDTMVRGLIFEALVGAIARHFSLTRLRHRDCYYLYPQNEHEDIWKGLASLVDKLSGKVPRHSEIEWHEGIEVQLEWANGGLWLVFLPKTVFPSMTKESRSAANDFARERSARRYNKAQNSIMDYWFRLLTGPRSTLFCFNSVDGVDAGFMLSEKPAFSWRT